MKKQSRIIMQKTAISKADEDNMLPIIWVNEFDFPNAINFVKALQVYEADPNVKEIFIYIGSYGGEVMPLLTMLDAVLTCSKPVHSITLGTATSCGCILAISVPGTRFIGENSHLHIHHVRSMGMLYEDSQGIEQDLKAINKIENKLFKAISKRSGASIKEIRKKLKEENREWHCSAEEALKWGFVDFIKIPKLTSSIIVECEY